jgi:hypothetical protein
MLAKIVPLQKRFPMGTRHIMAKNLVIAPFLINANIDEALMSRHIMKEKLCSKIASTHFSG